MEGSRRICALIIVLVCFLQDFASCSDIVQGPQNVTALSGSNASFTCTVKQDWTAISWYLQGTFVVRIERTGTTVSNEQIEVRNNTNDLNGEFTTEMTIVNVRKSNTGSVQCSSFSSPNQEAYLTVQVKGSVAVTNGSSVTVTPNSTVIIVSQSSGWYPNPTITWNINNTAASSTFYSTDYTTESDGLVSAVSKFTMVAEADTNLTCLTTVQTLDQPVTSTVTILVQEHIPATHSGLSRTAIILIAVFVSFGGLFLLIVLIVIIVICCCRKEKKEKKEKKETGYQSESWRAPEPDVRAVQNFERAGLGELNYVNYAYTPEPLSVAPSFRSNRSDSAFSEATTTPKSRTSKVVAQDWIPDYLKKTRHVTHV